MSCDLMSATRYHLAGFNKDSTPFLHPKVHFPLEYKIRICVALAVVSFMFFIGKQPLSTYILSRQKI